MYKCRYVRCGSIVVGSAQAALSHQCSDRTRSTLPGLVRGVCGSAGSGLASPLGPPRGGAHRAGCPHGRLFPQGKCSRRASRCVGWTKRRALGDEGCGLTVRSRAVRETSQRLTKDLDKLWSTPHDLAGVLRVGVRAPGRPEVRPAEVGAEERESPHPRRMNINHVGHGGEVGCLGWVCEV